MARGPGRRASWSDRRACLVVLVEEWGHLDHDHRVVVQRPLHQCSVVVGDLLARPPPGRRACRSPRHPAARGRPVSERRPFRARPRPHRRRRHSTAAPRPWRRRAGRHRPCGRPRQRGCRRHDGGGFCSSRPWRGHGPRHGLSSGGVLPAEGRSPRSRAGARCGRAASCCRDRPTRSVVSALR
jgi:hypothetical protein